MATFDGEWRWRIPRQFQRVYFDIDHILPMLSDFCSSLEISSSNAFGYAVPPAISKYTEKSEWTDCKLIVLFQCVRLSNKQTTLTVPRHLFKYWTKKQLNGLIQATANPPSLLAPVTVIPCQLIRTSFKCNQQESANPSQNATDRDNLRFQIRFQVESSVPLSCQLFCGLSMASLMGRSLTDPSSANNSTQAPKQFPPLSSASSEEQLNAPSLGLSVKWTRMYRDLRRYCRQTAPFIMNLDQQVMPSTRSLNDVRSSPAREEEPQPHSSRSRQEGRERSDSAELEHPSSIPLSAIPSSPVPNMDTFKFHEPMVASYESPTQKLTMDSTAAVKKRFDVEFANVPAPQLIGDDTQDIQSPFAVLLKPLNVQDGQALQVQVASAKHKAIAPTTVSVQGLEYWYVVWGEWKDRPIQDVNAESPRQQPRLETASGDLSQQSANPQDREQSIDDLPMHYDFIPENSKIFARVPVYSTSESNTDHPAHFQWLVIEDLYGPTKSPQGSVDSVAGDSNKAKDESDSRHQCVICLSDDCEVVLLPCRHLCMCMDCWKRGDGNQSASPATVGSEPPAGDSGSDANIIAQPQESTTGNNASTAVSRGSNVDIGSRWVGCPVCRAPIRSWIHAKASVTSSTMIPALQKTAAIQ